MNMLDLYNDHSSFNHLIPLPKMKRIDDLRKEGLKIKNDSRPLATLIVGFKLDEDSQVRIKNILFLLKWINYYYKDIFNVLLVEQGSKVRFDVAHYNLSSYVSHRFLYNPKCYNRGWGYNASIKHFVQTPVIVCMDTDILPGSNFLQEVIDCHEKFDVILMMGVYGYFKNNKIVLKNINSMLNKDGHLIFTIGNKTSIFRQVNILIDFMVKNCLMSSILDVYRKFILKRTDKLKINHFKSSNLKKTKDLLDKSGFEFIEKKNLVFSSGVLGKRSVKISNFYSKFKIFEYLNQGFSMIITAKKK